MADGDDLVRPPQNLRGVSMHRVQGDHWGKVDQQSAGNSSTELISGQTVTHDYESFAELDFGRVRVEYELETDTGDLMIRQQASAKQDGVWGVSWWIADIPLTYAILVPGTSGVRLTADAPESAISTITRSCGKRSWWSLKASKVVSMSGRKTPSVAISDWSSSDCPTVGGSDSTPSTTLPSTD